MRIKKLFVLASSLKNKHRCVAGREIVKKSDGLEYYGPWLRPVSYHDKGALSDKECILTNRKTPVPLDVLQVPVEKYENNFIQPENWFIRQGVQWRKITGFSGVEAGKLVEHPENLWLQPNIKQERATPEFVATREKHQSLYLIKPRDLRFEVETKSWDDTKRIRVQFNYNDQDYNFPLTDPLFDRKYIPDFPYVDDGIVEIEKGNNCLLCISLTPEYQGLHYKIVATVLEI